MAHTASTVLLCAIGDDVQLLALAVFYDLACDLGARNSGVAKLHIAL